MLPSCVHFKFINTPPVVSIEAYNFSCFLISLQVISSPLLSFPYSFLVPSLHITLLLFIALSQYSFSSLLFFDLVSSVTPLPMVKAQRHAISKSSLLCLRQFNKHPYKLTNKRNGLISLSEIQRRHHSE